MPDFEVDRAAEAVSSASGSAAGVVVPSGVVVPFAGSAAPSGWLLCDGSVLSQDQYPELFAVLGTAYNSGGEDVTQFRLPDLRGRTVAGLDNMGGSDASRLDWANTLGTAGGAQTHTLSASESGVPAHSHGITDPGHNHGLYQISSAGGSFAPNYSMGTAVTAYAATVPNTTGITVNNNSASAASSAHNNMQPTMLLNYIVKV